MAQMTIQNLANHNPPICTSESSNVVEVDPVVLSQNRFLSDSFPLPLAVLPCHSKEDSNCTPQQEWGQVKEWGRSYNSCIVFQYCGACAETTSIILLLRSRNPKKKQGIQTYSWFHGWN